MTPELSLVLIGWAIAGGSPGPATLAISGTSLAHGRSAGLVIAAGIVAGSASWGIAAALGMSAVMMANAWLLEIIRYAGAGYLLFLAYKAFRRGLQAGKDQTPTAEISGKNLWWRGYLLHITNPKAILAWGAIYSIALPIGATGVEVWVLFGQLISVSCVVFLGYAILFSTPAIARGYARARRWFEFGFAALFGAASLQILSAKLTG